MPHPPAPPEHPAGPTVPPWSLAARIILLVIVFGAGLWLINLARPVWWLLIIAFILAYLLQPLIRASQRIGIPRALAASLFMLAALVLLIFLPIVLIPALLADIRPLSFDVVGWLNTANAWVQSLPQTLPGFDILGFRVDLVPLYDQVALGLSYIDPMAWLPTFSDWVSFANNAVRSAGSVLGFATNVATAVFAVAVAAIFGLFMLFIFTLYVAKDLPLLLGSIVQLVPPVYQPEWRELWRRTGRVWNAFFRGQIVLSLVVGIAIWLSLRVMGVPGALLLGIIAGLLEVLPNIGPVLAAVPAFIIALLGGSILYPDIPHLTIALIVMALYTLVQQLENYILVPRILGGSIGLHPAIVLIGVVVFSLQFGIVGAFVAAPVLATILVWGDYARARLLGLHPYPALLPPAAVIEPEETQPLVPPPAEETVVLPKPANVAAVNRPQKPPAS